MPTEVKDDEKLLQQIDLDDDKTAVPRTHVDDEYNGAGVTDPKVMVTTSHNPSTKLVQFAKVITQARDACGPVEANLKSHSLTEHNRGHKTHCLGLELGLGRRSLLIDFSAFLQGSIVREDHFT